MSGKDLTKTETKTKNNVATKKGSSNRLADAAQPKKSQNERVGNFRGSDSPRFQDFYFVVIFYRDSLARWGGFEPPTP